MSVPFDRVGESEHSERQTARGRRPPATRAEARRAGRPAADEHAVRRLAAYALGRALSDRPDRELRAEIRSVALDDPALLLLAHQRLTDLPGESEPTRRRALDLLLLAYDMPDDAPTGRGATPGSGGESALDDGSGGRVQ